MTSVNTRLTRNSSVTGLKTNVFDENAMLLSKSINSSNPTAQVKKVTTTSTITANGAKRTTLGDLTNALQSSQENAVKKAIKPILAPSNATVTSNANKLATAAPVAAAAQPALRQRVPLKTSVVVPSKSAVTIAAPAATSLVAAKPKVPVATSNVGTLGIVGSSFNYADAKYAAPQVIHEDELLSDSEEEDESSEQVYDEDEGLEIQNEPTRSESGIKNIDVDPMEIEKETTKYHQHHIARAKTEDDFLDFDDIEDIDILDQDDPQFCTEYINLIFDYLRKKEVRDAPSPLYMDKQVDIVEKHRTILVDWMAEVAVKFRLLTETFFLSINLVDRFLQFKAVARQKLQLVGITAMLLASKYEEIYTPEVRDFIWITAKAYTRDEVLNMERNILVTLNFNLSTPTPIHFLRRFSKAARSDSKIHTLSKYITELSLLEYKMLEYLPSQIAASAVYISRKMCGISPLWNSTLEFHTRYTEEDILPCVRDLNAIVKKQETSKYRAIYKKYVSPKLLAVATIPICEDL